MSVAERRRVVITPSALSTQSGVPTTRHWNWSNWSSPAVHC
ncbi:MAG: hypothetical protein AB7V20_14390 [Phycisphaerales bacterium]